MDEKTADPKLADRLFATPLVSESEVADPPFLTAADKTEARAKVAALQQVRERRIALRGRRWSGTGRPADKVDVELLGEAERVMRNSCRSNASKELNHQLFVVVQGRFPGSEWAKKYRTWE